MHIDQMRTQLQEIKYSLRDARENLRQMNQVILNKQYLRTQGCIDGAINNIDVILSDHDGRRELK